MSISLKIRNATKSYGRTRALRDVSVDIEAGSAHGLIGPNGSGKSTLIWALTGRIKMNAGSFEINGEKIARMTPKICAKYGIELIPQELALVQGFDVWENIVLGAEPNKGRMPKQKGRRIAREVLDELGLDIGVDEPTAALDPGEQRLIMCARTFRRNANLVILDEPTAGLGEEDSNTVLNALDLLRSKGMTILFVSHYLSEVHKVCDTVTAMRDGQVSARLSGEDLTVDRMVVELSGAKTPGQKTHKPGLMKGETIIEGRHLAMPPLRQLNFLLHKGECLGFAGILGSGREKVIDTISGAGRLWGSVRVHGEFTENPREAVKAGLGILNGDRHLAIVPGWSVEKHVTLPILDRVSKGIFINAKKEAEMAAAGIKSLNVKAAAGDELADLSGGNQQRALLARWLMAESEVLLIDEPCVGVDIAARAELLAAIRDYAERNTVAMASSDPQDLVECCDRVLCMRAGVVVKELVGPEITEDAILRATLTASHKEAALAAN
ncbi:MAG: sugar ABC transporter ATP-binding protein [Maritimibacter sp.]